MCIPVYKINFIEVYCGKITYIEITVNKNVLYRE